MEKIKLFINSDNGKDTLIVLIVILVGFGSFELGRLSKESTKKGIKIEYTDENQQKNTNITNSNDFTQNTKNSNKNFFASSKGTKYYTISCSAGKTIKQENRIYFATGEEAETAGYALSSSCN